MKRKVWSQEAFSILFFRLWTADHHVPVSKGQVLMLCKFAISSKNHDTLNSFFSRECVLISSAVQPWPCHTTLRWLLLPATSSVNYSSCASPWLCHTTLRWRRVGFSLSPNCSSGGEGALWRFSGRISCFSWSFTPPSLSCIMSSSPTMKPRLMEVRNLRGGALWDKTRSFWNIKNSLSHERGSERSERASERVSGASERANGRNTKSNVNNLNR